MTTFTYEPLLRTELEWEGGEMTEGGREGGRQTGWGGRNEGIGGRDRE